MYRRNLELKLAIAAVIALLLLLFVIALTGEASDVSRTPDITIPHSPELNRASYWGEQCTKVEWNGEDTYGVFAFYHSLIIIKSSTWNYVWYDTSPGKYGTPDYKGVSHFIYCDGEARPTPTPMTPCNWEQYVLRDEAGHLCFIKRNYERGDRADSLPSAWKNTPLMIQECSKTCTGRELPYTFGKIEDWWTTCKACDAECGQ